MAEPILDDEGNEYTPEQVRAAVEQMVRDESGEGSMGGLAESGEGRMAATEDPNADVDRAVDAVRPRQTPGRELNPLNFGDFVSDNLFGGFDGKYITNKRPTTLFDYATDVLGAYGGEDIGRRNKLIREGSAAQDSAAIQAQKYGQDIKSGRARQAKDEAGTKKLGLETQKLATEAISGIFQDVDSDLWETRMGELEKENGIAIPKSTKAMVTRWMEKAREIGVENPQEVLDNPDAYDEGFVNRTRHTFRLIEKATQESATKEAELDSKKTATGIAQSKEAREAGTSAAQGLGLEQALDLLRDDVQSGDPAKADAAKGKIAALLEGGTSRQQVLQEMAGVSLQGDSGRNLAEKGYIERAREALTAEGAQITPGAVAQRVASLKADDKAASEGKVRGTRILADKEAAVAQGIATLGEMKAEVQRLGPGQSGIAGSLYTQLRQKGGRLIRDPQTSVVDSLAGDMVNVARTLGGEKGPLTEGDVRRIEQAVAFSDGDTLESWMARIEKAERVAMAGLEAIRQAMKSGIDTPVKIPSSRVMQMLSDDPAQDVTARVVGGGTDKASAAKQALQKANAIKDPAERKAFLAAERDRIKGMQ